MFYDSSNVLLLSLATNKKKLTHFVLGQLPFKVVVSIFWFFWNVIAFVGKWQSFHTKKFTEAIRYIVIHFEAW